MGTKLVTVRLSEKTVEELDRIVAEMNQRFSVKFEDEDAARRYTRSDVIRIGVMSWLGDHKDAIDSLI